MTGILAALGSGLSASKILEFLMRKSPELAPKITKVLASGMTAEKVVKFFSKDKNFEKLKALMEEQYSMNQNANPMVQAQNVRSQNLASDPASSLHRAAPGILAGAGGLAAGMALRHALPNQLKTPTSQKTPENIAASSQTPPVNVMPGGQQPPVSPTIPQAPQGMQPEGKIGNVSEILNKTGSKSQIDALIASKNGPQEVSAFFEKFRPKEKKAIEKEFGMPFDKVVEDYISENSQQTQPEKGMQPEFPKFEKGSTATSPEGLGEVLEIRNGKAIIDVDGKKHKVNVDELEAPDFSEDEVANLYDELFAKIPEEHRSGFISWAGYDEDRNVLGFIPRGGKYEELEDITPEEAKMIKEGKGVARTTGETKEGLWVAGEDTRGGVISQIIHDRKRKNKANEDKQDKLFEAPKPEKVERGMKPLFDELEYARNLSRERERKKKIEERERKKREKDEAKKRKKQT